MMTADLWVWAVAHGSLFVLEGVVPFYALRNLSLTLASGAVGALLAPLLILATGFAASHGLAGTRWLGLPSLQAALLACVLFDLWMDLWRWLNHHVPLRWRLHRVRHTDPAMDSTTAVRFHPSAILLSTLANAVVLVQLGADRPLFVD